MPVNFPVLLGHDELARKLGFEGGLPASILVTRDAREVKIFRGPFKAQEVSRAIKHLLEGPARARERISQRSPLGTIRCRFVRLDCS
jgi:hypothetical protein